MLAIGLAVERLTGEFDGERPLREAIDCVVAEVQITGSRSSIRTSGEGSLGSVALSRQRPWTASAVCTSAETKRLRLGDVETTSLPTPEPTSPNPSRQHTSCSSIRPSRPSTAPCLPPRRSSHP